MEAGKQQKTRLKIRSGSKSESTLNDILKSKGFISRQWRAPRAKRMISSELLFRQFNLEPV